MMICIIPARTTATKKILKDPKSVIAERTIAVKPAAGPLTPISDLEINPTTIPPTIPAISPENKGAPLAKATPKHRGNATNNTTKHAGISFFHLLNIYIDDILHLYVNFLKATYD